MRGQEDSDRTQPTSADLNKTETGVSTTASESTDRVLEVIKKVPLNSMSFREFKGGSVLVA